MESSSEILAHDYIADERQSSKSNSGVSAAKVGFINYYYSKPAM